MAREQTNELLEMIDEGLLDAKYVVTMCLKYMSEDEVSDMMVLNDIVHENAYDDYFQGQFGLSHKEEKIMIINVIEKRYIQIEAETLEEVKEKYSSYEDDKNKIVVEYYDANWNEL